ncbi:MAG: alkaline phosphatase D family protein [Alphaproteobacteria bacterium]|nr:alkaline phosphatase D family protein [Alphaproteobacteria bacterium]
MSNPNEPRRLSRRKIIMLGAAAGGLAALPSSRLVFGQGTAPAIATADSQRPQMPHGTMAGDVAGDRAILWGRTDRPSRMMVEWSTTESMRDVRRVRGPLALDLSDFSARVDLHGLPAGQEIFYRVSFVDAADLRSTSAPRAGRFRTPPADLRDVTFQWSGDTAGQGWGINPEWGGMRIYETMRRANPDFFIHCGDTIYADGPIQAEVRLPDGTLWKNVVTPEKSKVAETLAEFRGAYKYNLMDENVRRFHAEVPQIWQWDDHEVTNNWSGSKDLSGDARYTEKRVPLLIARATRAFLEYAPLRSSPDEAERVYRHIPYGPLLDVFVIDMRSYRGPNTHNRQAEPGPETEYLGREQLRWLKQGLLASRATWKIIASDMPIGLLVGDGRDAQGRDRFEAVANGNGPVLGRELEIAELLRSIKHNGIRNVAWVTADTHYTGAHFYDPAKAQFADFDGFWEFMSGPLHAGTFGPNAVDDTFGMQVVWQKAPAAGQVNLPPSAGMQFYGEVKIDGRSRAMTVQLKDLSGATLWQRSFDPQG